MLLLTMQSYSDNVSYKFGNIDRQTVLIRSTIVHLGYILVTLFVIVDGFIRVHANHNALEIDKVDFFFSR